MHLSVRRVATACLLAAACTPLPDANVPRASPDATEPLQLVSNEDDTTYYVDDARVGEGRYLTVLVSDAPHRVKAKPRGYIAKEEVSHPPYADKNELRFTFLIEDQERYANASGPVAQAPAAGPAPASAPAPASTPAAAPAPTVSSAPPFPAGPVITAAPQRGSYALVVGVEHYRDLPPPAGARSDAESFTRVLEHTLGIPAANVQVALDDHATKGDIQKNLEWLKDNVPAGGRVYFFFSGHGAPDASSGAAYLIPYDGDAKFLDRTALPMTQVMAALGETKAKEVLAFVDSCFSGAGGRSVLPPGARPLVRVTEPAPAQRVALFSAAKGAEISGPSPHGGGLFTSYVVSGLESGSADGDGDGQVTLQELSDFVAPRVAREAKRDNREQHPTLVVGSGVGAASSFVVEWGLPAK